MSEILYLASGSPRRRELLAQLGLHVERIHAQIDESVLPDEAGQAYAERLARAKAEAGWQVVEQSQLPERPLLAADTTVWMDGKIYGKPLDATDARMMLQAFSGNTHQVITAVAVRNASRIDLMTAVTEVRFKTLSTTMIERYLSTGEAFDKAGAYGIQGKAAVFVEDIRGSFTGVVGLPLFETAALLTNFGYQFP